MLVKDEIRALIPHAGAMCLLDSVSRFDREHILCVSASHRRPDNPLAVEGFLHSVCGLEYAAQAMALHGSLIGLVGSPARAGYIANVRDLKWTIDRLDQVSGDLEIEATHVVSDGMLVKYTFVIRAQGQSLLGGQAMVVLQVE